MIVWSTKFLVIQPMASFARPLCIDREIQTSASYYNQGPFHQGEKHCFMKYTLSGRGIFENADGKHDMTAGKAFLCDVTSPGFSYYYPPDASDPWEFIWLGFVGKNATSIVRELIERNGAIYDLPVDSGIIPKLMKYKSYNGLICEMTPFDGAKLVTDALGAVAASCWSQHPDDPRSVLIRKTQQIISKNLGGKILISDIAQQLHMSREHLSRVFKEHLGVSPQEYILRQKMVLACKLLKDTQLSNKEISVRLGYDLPTHFARAFKNLLHITPTQFREMPSTPLL